MKWLRANGWPDATRQPLHGNRDHGDILLATRPTIIAEVKYRAGKVSHQQVEAWWQQTDDEAVHAGADLAVLIVHTPGRSPQNWQAWMPADDWIHILTGEHVLPQDAPWLACMRLADWSAVAGGWWDNQ